jgi:hypothetical protein
VIKDYGHVYAGAWRYMLAVPLLFAVPVAIEFIQHVIEMGIGMYDGVAGAQAAEGNQIRLGWGVVKTMSISLALYWVARFLVLPGGAAAARRFDPAAARLFAWVMAFALVTTILSLWGGDWMHAVGLGAYTRGAGIALFVLGLALTVLLAPWRVGAAIGREDLGFIRSIALVGLGLWWGLILSIGTVLPLMVAHYALSIAAVFAPAAAAEWALLAVDAVLVGYLAAVMAAADVAIARRALARAGGALAPA